EELVHATKDRLIRAAAQPSTFFVRDAQREKCRLLELERERLFGRIAALGERTSHPNRLERFLAEVVRLLGIQRKDLERDVRIGDDERDHGPDAEFLERLQSMVAVWCEVLPVIAHRDDGI